MYKIHYDVIYLYKLSQEDRESSPPSIRYECIDGQHRLTVLYHYTHSLPIQIGKKQHMIYWAIKHQQKEYVVFYERNAHTEEWEATDKYKRTAYYMTEDEKREWMEYYLPIITITEPLPLNKRRQLFCEKQEGRPVRNSDLFKNNTDTRLPGLLAEHGYEEKTSKLLEFCSRKMINYWIQWDIKLYMLFSLEDEMEVDDVLMKYTDRYITELIKREDTSLNIGDREFALFNKQVDVFLEFLEHHCIGIKLNPIQLFAVFIFCKYKDVDVIGTNMGTHMKYWAARGKKYKSLWEGKKDIHNIRGNYLLNCLDDLELFKETIYVAKRPRIGKTLRTSVWRKVFGCHASKGMCRCGETIYETSFECGHIFAHSLGYPTTLENLYPICESCNKKMGTQPMDEYFHEMYPSSSSSCSSTSSSSSSSS
jgi:5-methylcytosine-specific restriction endonuclease McrA